jgi:hypothetical protein
MVSEKRVLFLDFYSYYSVREHDERDLEVDLGFRAETITDDFGSGFDSDDAVVIWDATGVYDNGPNFILMLLCLILLL